MNILIDSNIIDDQITLYETTYATLEKNTLAFSPQTSKREYSIDPLKVISIEFVPSISTRALISKGVVQSNSGKEYNTVIEFMNVKFEDEDKPSNVTFVGADQETYHMIPINLRSSDVKVSCTCLDFYYRFAHYNKKDGSLYGKPPPPYKRKTLTRPPVNIKKIPGVCKHIMKTLIAIKDSGIVV